MINTQKVEKPDHSTDGVEVHSIWDTIQGEGPFSGSPATFIRLAGCNLACKLCDTDYTSTRTRMNSVEVIFSALCHLPQRRLIVITGGEPFRQAIWPLIGGLVVMGRDVQIETNGTIDFKPKSNDVYWKICQQFAVNTGKVTIVCSPKTQSIYDGNWDSINCLKYVVQHGMVDEKGLPISSVGPQYGVPAQPPEDWKGEIYIQPLDEQDTLKNAANLATAVNSCQEHGYRLCIQTHKLAGLD